MKVERLEESRGRRQRSVSHGNGSRMLDSTYLRTRKRKCKCTCKVKGNRKGDWSKVYSSSFKVRPTSCPLSAVRCPLTRLATTLLDFTNISNPILLLLYSSLTKSIRPCHPVTKIYSFLGGCCSRTAYVLVHVPVPTHPSTLGNGLFYF
jgi:hypothetical protein